MRSQMEAVPPVGMKYADGQVNGGMMAEPAQPQVTSAIDRLRAALADVKVSLADELIAQRRKEAEAEEANDAQ
jgi:hypothetical protein